jgi:NADH-quinone oxidoreductase subunit G
VHGILDRGEHAEISTYISKAIDNDFSGNMIDVCPVGALTDRTFRFKNRVWFLKPMNARRDCDKCCGQVTLWNRGDEVFRVTTRKDEWGEVENTPNGKPAWICNTCRFDKKKTSDWVIEGVRKISRHSVISAGKYTNLKKPTEVFEKLMDRKPKLLMDVHQVSEINKPEVDLSKINGPATGDVFEKETHETPLLNTEYSSEKRR